MSESSSYHVGTAVRDKDGKRLSYSFQAEPSFYTRSSADKALRVLLADYARRKIDVPQDEFSVVCRKEGQPDRTFDYWRDPHAGLPPEGQRVLLYCETTQSKAIEAIVGEDVPRWIIVIGEWNGSQWTEDRSSKRPPFPVKYWMSIPEEPA